MSRRYLVTSSALVMAVLIVGFLCSSQIVRMAGEQKRTKEQDREALMTLENEWLLSEHDATKLESILASDFVHPVPTGDFLTREQHIFSSSKYLPPANLKNRFGDLKVRIYGDVGIVNGIVITSDEKKNDVNKTIFTDVFVYRDGRWEAVNAQENHVEDKPQRK